MLGCDWTASRDTLGGIVGNASSLCTPYHPGSRDHAVVVTML